MSINGAYDVNMEALQRWFAGLPSKELPEEINIDGNNIKLNKDLVSTLYTQLEAYTEIINDPSVEDKWTTLLYNFTPFFYNIYLKYDHNSIRFADYYETFIIPIDMKSYKKLIKGFTHKKIGNIQIKSKNGQVLARIGEKSDLIWSVFLDMFIQGDCYPEHTFPNHDEILTIQMYNVENLSSEELKALSTELLLQVSMESDIHFKHFQIEPEVRNTGENSTLKFEYTPTGFEQIPMLYLSSAVSTTDERLAYLSYYQVMEYFFVRMQNYNFLENFDSLDRSALCHNDLRKLLAKHRKNCGECESLKLVLTKSVDVQKLKEWLASTPSLQKLQGLLESSGIDFSKSDDKVKKQLAERVYSFRCSITHAKGDVDEYMAVPTLSKEKLVQELPLIKFLAFEVIAVCSEE